MTGYIYQERKRLSIERIEPSEILTIDALPVTTVKVSDPASRKRKLLEMMEKQKVLVRLNHK